MPNSKEQTQRLVQQLQSNKTCKCDAYEPLPKASLWDKPRPPRGMRRLKVYYKWPSGSERTVSLVMLQGEWLRKAGSDIGDEVLVTVERNRLVIDFEKKNGN